MAQFICYGILYFAEAVIAWLYFDSLFPRKCENRLCFSTFMLGYAALYCITAIHSIPVNTVSFFIIHLWLSCFNFQCSLKTAAFHTAFLTFTMAVTEIVGAWLISISGAPFGAWAYSLPVLIVMAAISKLLYFAVTVLTAKYLSRGGYTQAEFNFVGMLYSLPILSIIISIVVAYVGIRSDMTPAVEVLMITIVLILLMANIVIMVLYNHMQRLHAEHLTMELGILREKADAEYYKALKEQLENQRILIHDIKKHLNTISILAGAGNSADIMEYIGKLEDILLPSHFAKMCPDPTLNLVLLQYSQRCKEKKITFTADIRDGCQGLLDAPSITTLYGNLLSNAMEAAEKSKERMIELSVTKKEEQQIVIISVINSCDEPPVTGPSGQLRTLKSDRVLHGVGLKSIQRIVDHNRGVSTMYYDAVNQQFHHVIQFSMHGFPQR